jgi:hypothetical protein
MNKIATVFLIFALVFIFGIWCICAVARKADEDNEKINNKEIERQRKTKKN